MIVCLIFRVHIWLRQCKHYWNLRIFDRDTVEYRLSLLMNHTKVWFSVLFYQVVCAHLMCELS